MNPQPTAVRAYPRVTRDVFTALEMFCAGCPIGREYNARERELKDMKGPNGAVILSVTDGNIFQDPVLNQLKNVCSRCLMTTYPELLQGIQQRVTPS
jgi:hypothetical protein